MNHQFNDAPVSRLHTFLSTLLAITAFRQRHAAAALRSVALAILVFLGSSIAGMSQQLGIYNFNGTTNQCPNPNNTVSSQPANATFSVFSTTGTTCSGSNSAFVNKSWSTSTTIDLTTYNEFTISAANNYVVNLSTLSFTHAVDQTNSTNWALRSNLDNFATNIASGSVTTSNQTPLITLPAATFTAVGSVTFRFYLLSAKGNGTNWSMDNVTVNGTVVPYVADPANPTSNSPQCNPPGVTLAMNGTAPSGETWYWQTAANGTSTANSAPTNMVLASGTYYVRSRNDAVGNWSKGAGSATVVVNQPVSNVIFDKGTSSVRCFGAEVVQYKASATSATSITYALDDGSMQAGNSINAATGDVTFAAGFTGTSVVTATASGCGSPVTASHTITTRAAVATPVFAAGATSTTCQASGTISYTATATNSSGMTYALDAASLQAGNAIDAGSGMVTFAADFSGRATITATATGCTGPATAIHTVTVTPSVGTPAFTLGSTSARCRANETVTYDAKAFSASSLSYSLDAASISGGNSINAKTGAVTWVASWTGTSTITATAAGCNGPVSATHTVVNRDNVATPVFDLGATSTICQGTAKANYIATAANATSISYSLDTASANAGNFIRSTGQLTYTSTWSGMTTVTATASGCGAATSATHTVTIVPPVDEPVFDPAAASARCQGAGTISYVATANNTTGITYAIDNVSVNAGNNINATTGALTFAATWTGNTTITAYAAGCSGPVSATFTVATTPTVSTPVFSLGATSTRCQGAGTQAYTATATNTTGLTYALDAASLTGGNTINSVNGVVTFIAGWSGTTTITATATGCNGTKTTIHTVTVTPTVGAPVFTSGGTSTRCQGAGTVSYTATASDNTGITYSLDNVSLISGNKINATTGVVTYASAFYGTSTITATASGCNGPKTAAHTVTTNQDGTPTFAAGPASTRCQAAGTVVYTASTPTKATILYNLDAASVAAGNTINTSTGAVTFVGGWNGKTVITAVVSGCNGSKTATHTVTIIPDGTPSFSLGSLSTRQQGAGTVTYTATASNCAAVTYSLDAASIAAGNTISASTGTVTYVASWSNNTVVTASATGCNGTVSATHTVTINSNTVVKQLYLTDPAQGLDRIDPVATNDLTTSSTSPFGVSTSMNTIATDKTASNSVTGSRTLTISGFTTGTGTDRYMLAGISTDGTVSTVTYAGQALTRISATGSGTARVELWGLINPPSGTANVVITNSAPSIIKAGVTTFTGVDQSSPYRAPATTGTGNSTPTLTLTSAAGELVYDVTGVTNAPAATAGTGQTELWNIKGTTDMTGAASIEAGQTSSSLSWTTSTSPNPWSEIAVSLKPSLQYKTLTVFTQGTSLCSDLSVKGGKTISITAYVSITSGTMPAAPKITAALTYGSTAIITLSSPAYNAATGLLTWTGTLPADATIPAGQQIKLTITSAQSGVIFSILYDSQRNPSMVSLPVSTYIDVSSLNIYSAPYPAGSIIISAVTGSTNYIRATATDPFGSADITGMDVRITPGGNTVPATQVAAAGCQKTYEYTWNSGTANGSYNITAIAKEGYEKTVTSQKSTIFSFCTTCPPVAVNDSASGAGGAPLLIDVLLNDYDPNKNLNPNSLTIVSQPQNGSALLTGSKIVYLPNGTYAGKDTLTYQICDQTSLCATGQVFLNVDPTIIDPCSDAAKSHTYYVPYPEADARTALLASQNAGISINNIRTIISLKMPYPNMKIVWDQWEDGYETNILSPQQNSTKVWGDGNPYNGIAPGYPNDIIPAGGSIVLDNTMPVNPRNQANIFYDGRDKIYASGQITMTQALGEPTAFGVQAMKTNISSTTEFGKSFTIPVGENFNSQDFRYTALFIRAATNGTVLNIDKDNNGTFETVTTLNEGQSYLVNGGVLNGAVITSSEPVGVDLHFGGVDNFSSREAPIYPASWYSNTYFTPVPTTHSPDTAVVMLYNSLSRPIKINWTSGAPANGVINLAAKTVVRFPLALSGSSTYKFTNPTGEAFTAIEIVDSYTPGGGGNDGSTYDWAFNLIASERLTTFATIAWAPGSTDGSRNDNPIWVTPANNTTIYVKYNGDVLNGGRTSPCGLHYDASYTLNALNYKKVYNPNVKDQSGIAIFTCDGTKIAAVYGEDPSTAPVANPGWDVGSTIQPFCALKLILANDDNAYTLTNRAVTIDVLKNDVGFQATVDPTSVITSGYLQPRHGTVSVNNNGTILYQPENGYIGMDTLEYNVCSTPSPVVCDVALVIIKIDACPTPNNQNILSGQLFLDQNRDGLNNDGGIGFYPGKVYLYADANCDGIGTSNELKDSVQLDKSGSYQFLQYPERTVKDDFDDIGKSSCAAGTDGTNVWLTNWTDTGDPSIGFCVTPAQSYSNTNVEIFKDGNTFALRLKNPNVSATRSVDLSGATTALLSFSYRRTTTAMTSGHNILVQASPDGTNYTTVFTIAGSGAADATYQDVFNQNITPYVSANTYIRFLTNSAFGANDTTFIDNISIVYLKYPICYITRVDSSTVVPNYYFTTASKKSATATSGGTCILPFDFGVVKKSVSVSGTLYNDVNGLTDSLVNGIALGAPSGTTVFAYLADTSGTVAFKTTVNSATGNYTFSAADVNTKYTLMLSTSDSAVNTPAPSAANWPAGWVSSGDTYGLANGAGTGIKPGSTSASVPVFIGLSALTNVNFGIESLPLAGSGKARAINPGGTNNITVSPTTFTNITPASDAAPGNITGLRIIRFPANVTSITINAVRYTATTFPANGLIVPVNTSGQPTQTVQLDPVDGYPTVYLEYYAIDNAGKESLITGTATVAFLVDTDLDGVPDIDDIDDDNDGITDFVELCGKNATSFSCLPNGSDPGGDDDNDGVVNYRDPKFGRLNAAGCIASLDTDGDGIPDHLDLDSDNDGIPDVVEAYGVDVFGDGIIDNFTDTDGDGLSQNVDANNTGAAGSGYGLGFVDFDGDGIPNYKDLDSDNDGIPDIAEVGGIDTNNEGRVDNFADVNGNGLNDSNELTGALLKTGVDGNSDGRADNYPNKNNDRVGFPNPYDLDSDGDGIIDAVEAGFPPSVTISKGKITGAYANGWATSVQVLNSLNLSNADGRGAPDFLDIDSDDDGISDNIEGQPTNSYIVPTDADSDGDGISDVYDLLPYANGGNGITPYDHDFDGIPDYIDTDTDNDGVPDLNEASKYLNLSQSTINTKDSDGDGLLDEFDNIDLNSITGTNRYRNVSNSQMGTNGSWTGPLPTGSTVLLIRTAATGDRDWRSTFVLPLTITGISATLSQNIATIKWQVENETNVAGYEVERSYDGITFENLASVPAQQLSSAVYNYKDGVSATHFTVLYYRVRQVTKSGQVFYSAIATVRQDGAVTLTIGVRPNPVHDVAYINIVSPVRQQAEMSLLDAQGQVLLKRTLQIEKGDNDTNLNKLGKLAKGVYMLHIVLDDKVYITKVIKD